MHIIFVFFLLHHHFLFNVLHFPGTFIECLPTFFLDWVDINSNLCVYTAMQVAKFPHVHLVAGGWYLDCSHRFVPEVEEVLYNILVSSALEVIELEEESKKNNLAPPSSEKEVASIKDEGKGRKIVAHASFQVFTCYFTKDSVERIVAPVTTATPSAHVPDPLAGPSHNITTIPSVLRKTKAVARDTLATSLERSSSLSLIENVDMGGLIQDLIKTKVYVPFYCFIHSFHGVQHLFILLIFFKKILFKLERLYSTKHQT